MKKSIRKFTLSILAATTGVLVASAAGVTGWALTQKNSQNKLTSITSSLNGSFDVVNHSQNVTVKQGEATTLVVNTTGETSNLIYNWYVDKGNGKGYSIVQGGAKNTYLLDEGQTRNVSEITHWTYKCEIKDRFTIDTLVVEDIHVTIQPTSQTFVTVIEQPQANVKLESGATTTLSTSAISSDRNSVVYQWFVDNGDNNGFQAISGATQSRYTIPASETTVSQQTVKKYLCRYASSANPKKFLNESEVSIVTITPKTGVDSNNPTLNSTVKIIAQSTLNPTVNTNGATSLSVSAQYSGSDYLVYDWYVKKPNADFVLVQGGSFNSLLISNDDIKDIKTNTIWEIYCNVYPRKDASQAVHSQKFTLTIKPQSEKITITSLTSTKKELTAGVDTAELSVVVSHNLVDSNRVKYQWMVSKDGFHWTNIQGATNPTLTINPTDTAGVTTNTTWQYAVMVSGTIAAIQSDNLSINIKPKTSGSSESPSGAVSITDTSIYQTTAIVNSNFQPLNEYTNAGYKVSTKDSSATYQWYYTTKFGDNSGGVKIDGATSNELKPNSELLKKAHELQSQGKTMYLYCNVYKNGKLAAIGSNSQFYLHVQKI